MVCTHTGVFLLLIMGAAFTDIAYGKVYNWLTVPGMLLGAGLAYVLGGFTGLTGSFFGFATGGGLFLVFFAKGWIGPGDVKLMAAIGALQGLQFTLYTVFLAACVGAIMAFGLLIWQGRFWEGIKGGLLLWFRPKVFKEQHPGPPLKMPYGLAISVGAMWTWVLFGFGVSSG